jgi:RNA polymerase sigma factor (sigma-70 family)
MNNSKTMGTIEKEAKVGKHERGIRHMTRTDKLRADLEAIRDVRWWSQGYYDDDGKDLELKRMKSPDELLKDFQGMILKIVSKCIALGAQKSKAELFAAGADGLLKAVKRYDKGKYKTRFSTYAYHWIKGYIMDQRADELDRAISLDDPISDHTGSNDGAPDPLYKILPCKQRRADELLESKELWEAVRRLPSKEAYIIFNRFHEDKTLQEIGDELNLTRERVRQIQKKALRTLRRIYRNLGHTGKAA